LRVLVAAGTGLAPFISIIRSELRRKREADVSRYVLLHGASYDRDLGYRDELLRLSRSNGLQYWATVSRPRECPDWKGDVGRVDSYFGPANLAKLERRLGLPAGGFTPRTVAVFVCELTGTIGATITNLMPLGFVPSQRRVRGALGVPADQPDSL